MQAAPPSKPSAEQAYELVGAEADPRIVLTCDHARNRIPAEYGDLGLDAAELARHIAYDVGARGVTLELARLLGAPAICSTFSRLLIDPNRGEDDPTLVMRLYDRSIIPGNARVDDAERERRLERFHRPYHQALAALLDRAKACLAPRGAKPLVVAIHSFTAQLRGGAPRPWKLGVLWGRDQPTARSLLEILRAAHPEIEIGENQPYHGALEGDAMWRHGGDRALPHVLIEIRNDLICDEKGEAEWAALLAPTLARLAQEIANA